MVEDASRLGSCKGMGMVRHVWGEMPKSGVWCNVGLRGSSLHLQLPEWFLCRSKNVVFIHLA